MRKRYLINAMAALTLLCGASSVGADQNCGAKGTCLAQLTNRVQPGKWVRVIAHDGAELEGRLETVDLAQSLLTVQPVDHDTTSLTTYEISEIVKLQYRESGRIRAGHLILGLAAGAILGAAIAGSSNDNGTYSGIEGYSEAANRFGDTVTGGFIGGMLGLGTGAIVSSLQRSTKTISCQ